MKKFINIVLVFAFTNMYFILPACSAQSIDVKSGVRIPIIVTTQNTSKNAIAGQRINAIIEDDVKINNVVVFRKGSPASLNVSDVKKAGFVGIAGEMQIVNGEVIDARGERHLIEYNQKITGEEKNYPKVCLACGVLIILAPIALLGFVKGGQAKLAPNSTMDVSLRNDFNFIPEL